MDRFAALADSNRRRIIELIAANGEMASTDISNEFEISAPAISQHLKVLRKADLVKMEKRAQQRIYSINPQGVDELWQWLNQMRNYWNARFDALDEFLNKERCSTRE
ncbi:MAG: winged helix-turn-helix transcriptional regulator [Hyphomicrobiales bacterium]|nr:winged helix-turn-helix transcriptional regulator [Hyphomicrobiales bacterium]